MFVGFLVYKGKYVVMCVPELPFFKKKIRFASFRAFDTLAHSFMLLGRDESVNRKKMGIVFEERVCWVLVVGRCFKGKGKGKGILSRSCASRCISLTEISLHNDT